VSPDVVFAVALCLEEAVVNIIMHNDSGDGRFEIAVELVQEHGAVIACVEDNGPEFDPTRVRTSTPATSLQDAKIGDVGMRLIRGFASEMRYQRDGGRNRLMLRFLEPGHGPG
jgi:serine/threonine-protein kinase RsbW